MEDFHSLLRKLGTNKMSENVYDTAWVARLHEFAPDLSNRALEWISERQLADGSWGIEKPMYYHDRVICTLSAMVALTYRGRRAPDKEQMRKGLAALEEITGWKKESLLKDGHGGATVGFELLVPILVADAERSGLITHQREGILGELTELRDAKMARLSGQKISRHIAFAHSAEITGEDKIHLLDVDNLQESNGSIGNSPSATAHFALYVKPGDPKALNYLRSFMKGDGGYPTIAPIEDFEILWVLWNLIRTGLHKTDNEIKALIVKHLDYLERHWDPIDGLSCSESFTPVDGDITSVGFQMLSEFGRNPKLDAVLNKEEERWFRCYRVERDPSVDANVHILGALRHAGYEKDHPSVQKIIKFVRSRRKPDGCYWLDKWNISPYYTTAHVTVEFSGYDDELCQEAADWILSQQQENGSWGSYGIQTAEETAYCIQALKTWQMYGGNVPKDRLEKAKLWLARNCEPPYPLLWIGKSLYSPELVTKSAIISALMLAEM